MAMDWCEETEKIAANHGFSNQTVSGYTTYVFDKKTSWMNSSGLEWRMDLALNNFEFKLINFIENETKLLIKIIIFKFKRITKKHLKIEYKYMYWLRSPFQLLQDKRRINKENSVHWTYPRSIAINIIIQMEKFILFCI